MNHSKFTNVFLLLLVIILNINNVYSIYEEEIGVKDWTIQNLGEFENFIELKGENQLLIQSRVLNNPANTNRDLRHYSYILSNLNLNNGNLNWRQILPTQENSFESLSNFDDTSLTFLTISGGNNIRLWNRKDGSLKWYTKVNQYTNCLESSHFSNDKVLVLCNNGRVLLDISKANGEIQNQLQLKQESPLHLLPRSNKLYSIEENSIEIYQYKSNNVEKLQSISKSSDSDNLIILKSNHLISFNKNNEIQIYNVQDSDKSKSIKLSTLLKDQSSPSIQSLEYNNNNQFTIKLNSGVLLLVELKPDSSLSTIKTIQNNNQDFKSISTKENGLINRIIKLDQSSYLLINSDWSIHLISSDDKLVWTREESLSAILNNEIIDYPLADISKLPQLEFEFNENQGFVSHFTRRITTQLYSLFKGTTTDQNIDNTLTSSSTFSVNLKKMIIVSTAAGKVFGLSSSEKGKIIWSMYFPEFNYALDKIPLESSLMRIFITKKVIHYPPEAVLIYEAKSTNQDQKVTRVIHHFNPLTGLKIRDDRILQNEILHVSMLPLHEEGKPHSHLLQLVMNYPQDDQPPLVYIHPWTELMRKNWESLKLMNFYLIQSSGSSQQIQGYRIDSLADGRHGGFKSLAIWSIQFPSQQHIISVGKSNPNEIIQSPAIILGNRNLLPKYINRNLISVATYEKSQSILYINLIDSVSGEILKTVQNSYSASYVSLVHTENSVVYSFFDILQHQQMLGSIDLFEKTVKWNDNTFSPFTRVNTVSDKKTDGDDDLIIKHKSFTYPEPIKTLGLAITEKGITAKTILVGSKSGQILPIDKKFINARRPYPPEVTPNDAEEGLIPYSPKLFFPPWYYITYNTTIPGLSSISSQGTELESTSLILATGIDVFCSLITPSLPYDILSDDFNHLALILTSIILLGLAIFSMNLKKKLTLNKKWK